MTDKELNVEQLENVTGGTVNELEDLFRAVFRRKGGSDGDFVTFAAHMPLYGNMETESIVYYYLRDNMGIRANISLGFLGTGAGSDPNTYKDMRTGQALTHQEVMARLNA